MDGYRTLKAGQPVKFDIIQGPKGLHAVNIQSVDAVAGVTTTNIEVGEIEESHH